MRAILRTAETEADIWTRIMYPDGNIPRRAAAAILQLSFTEEQRHRMRQLSAKARANTLAPDEEFEMQNFERVGDLLSILKSKARQALKRNNGKE
jgi:hypothetical protein